MNRKVGNYLIKARLKDIGSDINLVNDTLEVAEFAEHQYKWLEDQKKLLVELNKEQKTLEEELNVL